MCVSTRVWGGTADFLSLRESDVWKQREHLLSPCTLLQNHKVQMTLRPLAALCTTPTHTHAGSERLKGPAESIRNRDWSKRPQHKHVLVYGYRWLKELYRCPYTASLIDCTVSQRINDSFRFHTSRSAAQPVSPDSYQPQTHSSPSNTDKLMDIIMSMLSIMGYEHSYFRWGGGLPNTPNTHKILKLCLHCRLIYYEKQKD